MTLGSAGYLPLDGFEPSLPGRVLLEGERLFVADVGRLSAISLDGPRVEWESAHANPGPLRYQAPRCIHAGGRQLWAGHGSIVELLDADEGIALVARDLANGQERWRRVLSTPPPAEWTEARPAWDGAPTEELGAFLAASDVLVVALARTTRRSMLWPDHPLPEFHARLDLTRIEPSDGSVLWDSTLPDVSVSFLERDRFTRWLVAGRSLLAIDWATGAARRLAELPGAPSWPRLVGGRLAVAWRSRGAIGVDLFDSRTGERLGGGEWRRNGARETRLHACDRRPILQVNDQFVSLLSEEEHAPLWEARAKPYVYGVAAVEGGPIFVGTSGNGGGLYAFDRRRGTPVAEMRLRGGAWDPSPVAGTGLIASTCGEGLVVADGHSGRVEVVEIPGASGIAGSRDGHVLALSGQPSPGLHVVDARRLRSRPSAP